MAGGKTSPRQQMINMMYLVLTALLALNVSKEILQAFYLMETSMTTTGEAITEKIDGVMAGFKEQAEQQPGKFGADYKKAEKAKQLNDDFIIYVEKVKADLLELTGGRKEKEEDDNDNGPGELVMMDNTDIHAKYFINDGEGIKLQNKINETRNGLLSLVPNDSASLKSELKAWDEHKGVGENQEKWINTWLEHPPLAAVFTFLAKIENDCKNTTNEVIARIAVNVTKSDFKFDKLEAMIVPQSTFVMEGEKFRADIFLTAFNSAQTNPVYVGESEVPIEQGVAKFEQVANGQGLKKIAGKILVKSETGDTTYSFEQEYTVYKKAATISADKMNLLYKGLENPISVSVPGFAPSQVNATMSGGGSLRKIRDGEYIATISPNDRGTREVTVNAVVKLSDGSTRSMGSQKYRVRPVPKPEGMLGTLQSGSTASAGAIRAQSRVFASLGQSFAFEGVKYDVLGFECIIAPKRGQSMQFTNSGGAVSGQIRGAFGQLRSGDQIIIVNIKARGPDGTKDLLPIVITVQ